jgi:hypothetical protein
MPYRKILILLIAVAACCSTPAVGLTTKYLGASPEMSAYLYGVNDFSPGSDATITLKIQNSAVNSMVFLNATQLASDDLPTTAKFVTASLGSAGAPIQIKTDPQTLGDIKRQGTVTATFNVKIFSNATIGEYQLPLTLTYRYLNVQPQELGDTVYSTYNTVTDTIPITVNVKPTVTIDVLTAVPENLNVGTEGYLDLTIKNTGGIDGKKATVKIIRNGNSPVIPTDSSVFIGDFPQGSTISCRYKVAVSSDAGAQTYPVDVAVAYVNPEGDTVTSAYDTIGVPVGGKIRFNVTSSPPTLYPGETGVVVFEYQNLGTSTAYRAQARLNVVAPFTSADNSAYLGDIAPGARGTARYTLTADSSAPLTTYTFDTEIRYRDVFDNSQISNTFPATVQLVPAPGYTRLVPFLPVVVLVAIILIGAGYYVLIMRKKK